MREDIRDEFSEVWEVIGNIIERINHMAQQQDVDALTAELDAVSTSLSDAQQKLQAEVDDLQKQIDAGTPASQLDLSGVKAAADALAPQVEKLGKITPTPATPPASSQTGPVIGSDSSNPLDHPTPAASSQAPQPDDPGSPNSVVAADVPTPPSA